MKLRSWCRCHSVAHLDTYAPPFGLWMYRERDGVGYPGGLGVELQAVKARAEAAYPCVVFRCAVVLLLYGKVHIYGVREADGVSRHRQYRADKDGVYGPFLYLNREVNQYGVAYEYGVGSYRDFRYGEVCTGTAS